MKGIVIFFFFVFSDGFLLDSNPPSGSAQTDEHMLGIIDLIVEEKKIRHQLEEAVTQLKHEQDQLQLNFSTRASTLEAHVTSLQSSLSQAQQKNNEQATLITKLLRNQNSTETNIETMLTQLHKGDASELLFYIFAS